MVDFPTSVYLNTVEKVFPLRTTAKINDDEQTTLHRKVHTGDELLGKELDAHFSLLKSNLDSYYNKHGSYMYEYEEDSNSVECPWKSFKLEEMNTKELVYVSYYDEHDTLQFYVSFLLTQDDIRDEIMYSRRLRSKNMKTEPIIVYVYELQLVESLRGQGIGYLILNEWLPSVLKEFSKQESAKMNNTVANSQLIIQLTCFEDNLKALNFYLNKCKYTNLFENKRLQNEHYFILHKDV